MKNISFENRGLLEGVNSPEGLYNRYGNIFLGLLSFIIIAGVLFYGPDTGLSDNGDFNRVMKACSLSDKSMDRAFRYIGEYRINYRGATAGEKLANLLFGTENVRNYPSVQLVFVRISVLVNVLLNYICGTDPEVYRMSVLGTIYAIICSIIMMGIFREIKIKSQVADFLSKILIIFILCDCGYITYFNSFYGEAVQILALLLVVTGILRIINRNRLAGVDILLIFSASVLYGWSKFANIPAAIICSIVSLFMAIPAAVKKSMAIAAGIFTVCILALIYLIIPDWMDNQTTYNSIFFGIVKDTDEKTTSIYLKELGLPPETAELAGTNYYVDGIGSKVENMNVSEAIRKISKADILKFYLRHPEYFIEKLVLAVRHSGFVRPFYLSNSNNVPRFTQTNRFSVWSFFRIRMGFDTVYGNIAVFVAFSMLLAYFYKKSKMKLEHCLLLFILTAFMLAYHLAVPVVTNGEDDLAKHMFAYVQVIDLLFLFVVICGIEGFSTVKLRKAGFAPFIAFILVMVLCVRPFTERLNDFSLKSKKHQKIEVGSYISFGTIENKEIIWLVTNVSESTAELIATRPVGEMPFYDNEGQYGSNYWPDSTIRFWLNNDFIRNFSDNERNYIKIATNPFLLSKENKKYATAGRLDFYCNHIPEFAARGYESAIASETIDMVYLPDIRVISELSELGYDISQSSPYWLETPYFNNGSMVRCVFPDGYIYFRDAADTCAVIPSIRITTDLNVSGDGSFSSPFEVAG